MGQRKLTPEELKLMTLFHQLLALGSDSETAARIEILRPDGTRFGSVSLSDGDLDKVTDVLASVNETKQALDEAARFADDDEEAAFAEALAIVGGQAPLPEPTAGDVDDIVSGFEALLRGEGGKTA